MKRGEYERGRLEDDQYTSYMIRWDCGECLFAILQKMHNLMAFK